MLMPSLVLTLLTSGGRQSGGALHMLRQNVEIPRDLLSFHENMTLDAYVMCFNSIPFLVLALHNIHLITIEHTPKHCSTSKLGYILQCIINVCAWAGFCLQTILMNNEFKKVGPST